MLFKNFFSGLSEKKIITLLRESGSLIGSRDHAGRIIYIYLIKDFFVQVMFRKDDPIEEVEYIQTFSDIQKLNSHLEHEFKTSFATR